MLKPVRPAGFGVWKRLLWAVPVSLLLTACGGGGGGGGATLIYAFAKTVTLDSTDGQYGSMIGVSAGARYQTLYLASDIGGSAGMVTAVGFQLDGSSGSATCTDVEIRMGHTNVSTLGTTFDLNVDVGRGSHQTVLTAGTVNVPTGAAGTQFFIPLDTPFYYNGRDNLVVDFIRRAACSRDVALDAKASSVAYNAHVANDTNGDAAGGTAYGDAAVLTLYFTGGENQVLAAGTTLDQNDAIAPGQVGRTHMLFLASDIAGAGDISGIGFHTLSTNAGTLTYSVRALPVSTSITTVNFQFSNNFTSGTPTVLADNETVEIPAGRTFFWLPLTGTLTYDGKKNLMVEVVVTSFTGTNFLLASRVSAVRVVKSDSTLVTTGSTLSRSIEPVLRFAGAPFGRPTLGVASCSSPFGAAVSRSHNLVSAVDLGSAGSITKIAFRAAAPTLAVDKGGFTVVMDHTAATALNATFANNLSGAEATARAAAVFSVPGGLSDGDWIEIPLDTPFAYNGADNLLVEVTSSSGTSVGVKCLGSTDYTGHYVEEVTTTTGTGTAGNFGVDLLFWTN